MAKDERGMGRPNGVEWRDIKMIKNGWVGTAAEDGQFIVSCVTARALGLLCCLYQLHLHSWKSYQELAHKTKLPFFPPKVVPPMLVLEASPSTQVPAGQPRLMCDPPFLSPYLTTIQEVSGST